MKIAFREMASGRAALLACVLVMIACEGSARAAIPATKARSYPMPGHGTLTLNVPAGWNQSTDQETPEMPGTIIFSPAQGPDFKLSISPMASPRPDPSFTSAARMRAMAERARVAIARSAVEEAVPLVALCDGAGRGFYYSATGRNASPNGYRFITQGVLAVRELVVDFTILSNGDEGHPKELGLGMLRELACRQGPAASGDDTLALAGLSWHLAFRIPGFDVEEEDERDDGSGSTMMARDNRSDIALTISLEKQDSERANAECRELAWGKTVREKKIKSGVTRETDRLAIGEFWLQLPGGTTQRHLHAYVAVSDVCAEVHLSKAGYLASDRAIFDRILDSVRVVQD